MNSKLKNENTHFTETFVCVYSKRKKRTGNIVAIACEFFFPGKCSFQGSLRSCCPRDKRRTDLQEAVKYSRLSIHTMSRCKRRTPSINGS